MKLSLSIVVMCFALSVMAPSAQAAPAYNGTYQGALSFKSGKPYGNIHSCYTKSMAPTVALTLNNVKVKGNTVNGVS